MNPPMTTEPASLLAAATWVGLVGLRWLVGLHGHSGEGDSPRFGDFEAQRHWMEVTWHLPVSEWYTFDLQYWGLDYPPLTAYVSFLCGAAAHAIDPSFVALNASRGLETPALKIFMRSTVIALDLAILFPACRSLARLVGTGSGGTVLVALAHPALLLIDHGHFQYNGVCLGLAMGAVAAIGRDWPLVGSVLFCLSLNFKQMALYYAPGFFFFLLGACLRRGREGLLQVVTFGVTVLLSFGLLWAPFALFAPPSSSPAQEIMQVLVRLFPFKRGIFEDKVANFWYAASVVYDFRDSATLDTLKLLSLGLTLTGLAPSAVVLLRHARHQRVQLFLLGLFNIALAFFLFSFQVHEKSILLPLFPLIFLFHLDPPFVIFFSLISVFSMHPLLKRDGLSTAYFGTCLFFTSMALFLKPREIQPRNLLLKLVLLASGVGVALLHTAEACVAPPAHLPHLFPALFSLFAFVLFSFSFLYGNVWLFRMVAAFHVEDAPRGGPSPDVQETTGEGTKRDRLKTD